MLFEKDGKTFKYVCPSCGGDGIGESGMGMKYVHCFRPCYSDIPKDTCPTALVTSEEEKRLLSQESY
jgi:hypothetical protein